MTRVRLPTLISSLLLSVLARLAARIGITAIPLYLLGGLAVGEGGLVALDVSQDFISLTAEIGVLLLLLTLGLEYSAEELRSGIRTGAAVGALDKALIFQSNKIPPDRHIRHFQKLTQSRHPLLALPTLQ